MDQTADVECRAMLPELKDKIALRLTSTRAFSSGVLVHYYHRT